MGEQSRSRPWSILCTVFIAAEFYIGQVRKNENRPNLSVLDGRRTGAKTISHPHDVTHVLYKRIIPITVVGWVEAQNYEIVIIQPKNSVKIYYIGNSLSYRRRLLHDGHTRWYILLYYII